MMPEGILKNTIATRQQDCSWPLRQIIFPWRWNNVKMPFENR
jgi:hypothetical protein